MSKTFQNCNEKIVRISEFVWFEHFLDIGAEILTIFSLHFRKINSEIKWPLEVQFFSLKFQNNCYGWFWLYIRKATSTK